MSKLLKPLCILLAVLSSVAINGWRSARRTANMAVASLTTSSNKLAEATAKIVEKESANQTLQTKMNLRLDDQSDLSNRLVTVNRDLAKTGDALKIADELHRQREAQVASLTAELSATKESKGGELRIKRLETEKLQEKLHEAHDRAADLAAKLNRAETEKAELLQQWNDPAALRVQVQKLAQTGSPTSASKTRTAKLVLQPDGTVVATQFSAVPPPSNPRLQPDAVDGAVR